MAERNESFGILDGHSANWDTACRFSPERILGATSPEMHIIRDDIPICRQIPLDVDVVHFNDTVPYNFSAKPYVVTYHGNNISGQISRNAIFVSGNHAKRFSSESFVYNGLDWNEYGTTNLNIPRSYFHFLGKAAWSVKNVRACISMVKALPG